MHNNERSATFAERLDLALTLRGKKQVDLVQATKVNKSTVSRYLRGEREPKSLALFKIANFLDISEAWLLGYDVPMEKEKTAEQKKNDDLVQVIAKLRKDPDFFEVVSILAGLPPAEYASIKLLLSRLGEQ